MFRLGTAKNHRRAPVRRAERAGAEMGKRIDRLQPRLADGWHHAVDSAGSAGTEAKARTKATYHAIKGDLRVEPESHRKRNVAIAVGAVGAAAAAYMAARRKRQPEWLTADVTPEEPAKTTQSRLSARTTTGRPADRAGASPDEILSDAAEAASKATAKAPGALSQAASRLSH